MAKPNLEADCAAVETLEDGKQDQHMPMFGKCLDITMSAIATTIPILILSVTLLALVFGFPSNASTANIWQSVMAYTTVGNSNLKQAASVAAMGVDSQQFADDMALAFSKTALAIGSQVVEKRPVGRAQKRSQFLVAKIPAAPLYVLVAVNMLVALVSIVLKVVALRVCRGDVKEVQSSLSIHGLVADRLEGESARLAGRDVSEFFRESKGEGTAKVVMDKTVEGGFEYKTKD
ncbi:hypothetical protein M436DRAFT_64673 [Aureobasidium namibiae CBS 147.97]|uniref:Uncharacterized protein n=1 Tax=Aureobasidium namibiae CBS 147.97 TaxID=1043004 RepID=A0A074WHW4_9PEZI